MNVTTATPVEIDTALAQLENEIGEQYAIRDQAFRQLRRLAKGQMLAGATKESLGEEVERAEALLEDLEAAAMPYRNEFVRRGGWNRYYMVDNTGGHLHTTRSCRTTYASTSWYWMVEMSGMERWDAVEKAGALACLACFPEYREYIEHSRPGTIETPNQRKTREEREAAAKAKEEKAAAKAAKAITKIDGSPLREFTVLYKTGAMVETTYVVKTEVSARRQVAEAAHDLLWYGTDHPSAPAWRKTAAEFTVAIAAKTGEDLEALRTTVVEKAMKKVRRNGGEPANVNIFA